MNKKLIGVFALVFAAVFTSKATVFADSLGFNFEAPDYTTGNINGQNGWSKTGPYDHEVALNALYPSMSDQSLRISNSVTSGSFGDHTISPSLTKAAGETGADGAAHSNPPTSTYFEASWNFASVDPDNEQEGLHLNISPDRGDGARMSYVGLADTDTGLEVFFYDYQVGPGGPTVCDGTFPKTVVAGSLDRTVPHSVKIQMWFNNGPSNDVVTVTVDGVYSHTGTSWEDYFTGCESNPTRTVDSLIFLTRGPAFPANDGKGFFIDNVSMTTDEQASTPTSIDECKDGGWASFNNPTFKNQGDCVSFVASEGKSSNNPGRGN